MKYFVWLLLGFICASSAHALRLDPRQLTNTGERVPYGCEVWNDGCNDCKKTAQSYECPLKNCATMRAGYCKTWAEESSPVESPAATPANEFNDIPANCMVWSNGCGRCVENKNGETECEQPDCDSPELARCLAIGKPLPKLPPAPKRPHGCTQYFDGCNTCSYRESSSSCTQLKCDTYKEPKCLSDESLPVFTSTDRAVGVDGNIAIPKICSEWFNGCKNCAVQNGELLECESLICRDPVAPARCLKGQAIPLYSADPKKIKEEQPSFWGFIKYHLFSWLNF